MTVLVADDDEAVASLTVSAFQSEGYTVMVAHDGLAARDALGDRLKGLGLALP